MPRPPSTPLESRRQSYQYLPLVAAFCVLLASGLAVGLAVTPAGEPAAVATKGQLRATALGTLTVAEGALTGNTIRGAQNRQYGVAPNEAVRDPLAAGLVPTIVSDSARKTIAYSTWQQLAKLDPDAPGQGVHAGMPFGKPAVHVLDADSGTERTLGGGARSPALSSDGSRIAFFKAADQIFRINSEYVGQIYVGDPAGNDFVPWTTEAARYFPYAWAGDTLLAYRARSGSEGVDLYAFSGPDQSRLLSPDAYAIALSPDASKVLVFADGRVLSVISTLDGAVLTSMRLDGAGVAALDSPTTPHYVMFNGSWTGDRVVANSDAGLLVLKVTSDAISIESVLQTPSLPHGLNEPVLDAAGTVTGWADISPLPVKGKAPQEYSQALVRCDLTTQVCETGEARDPLSIARWIANPSR